MDDQVLADARILWDYHRLGLPAEPADVIVGLGSYDPAVAEWCAELYLQRFASWLLFTGGVVQRSDLLKTPWTRAEAEVFREIAVKHGVPADQILVEPRATNTGENIRFSLALLRERGISSSRVLLVTKPNMERRVRATAALHAQDAAFCVTSPPGTFEETLARFDPKMIVNLMVGDLQRIALYPAQGLQAAEAIPGPVQQAYERLVRVGCTKHMIYPQPTR